MLLSLYVQKVLMIYIVINVINDFNNNVFYEVLLKGNNKAAF
jgi:hypothetical protein